MLTTQELSRSIDDAFKAALSGLGEVIKQEGGAFTADTGSDPVLAELEKILAGRVGPKLEGDDYEQALVEAGRRVEARIPPGYMDAAKKDGDFAGDYIIWLQIIIEAK